MYGVSSPPSSRSVSAICALGGERRVAAGEDEAEAVVVHACIRVGELVWLVRLVEERGLGMAVVAGGLAAQPVDGAVAGGGGDPPAGVGRQPLLRPPLARDDERLLDHLFGDVDVAEETDQGGDDPAGLLSEDPFEVGGVDGRHLRRSAVEVVGVALERTDLDRTHAGGRPFAAHSSAASRSGASMTQKPPSCSLLSANGPSVMTRRRPRRRRRSRCPARAVRRRTPTHRPLGARC